ncbi:hypothetical protein RHGRI_007318 [Rhododendron griersonianum]|uniref:DNA polymerase alpha subunit B OB domain-containing protein n=1 Tax=Rhododendron griersonianum TaxID=479676 RepID=A0AAV6KX68_9ERIC|nr:hypothetical protein RHGRI_007318 [Rhododendron griersonianum]
MRVQPSARCSLMIHGSQLEPGCRFMYDKIEDKFNFLENRIRKHATALVASGLCEEVKDPRVVSQESVFAVGMICCDEEGRLKEKPVLLQSSVEHSGGQHVVGVEGHNPSGHCLIASKVIDYVPMSVPSDEYLHPTKKQAFENTCEGVAAILVIKCCIERRPDINILMTMTTLSAFHCFLGKWGKKAAEATKKAEDPVGDMWQHCTMYGGLIDARFKSQDHGVKSAPPHSTIEKTFGGNHISTTTTQFRIWLCTMR